MPAASWQPQLSRRQPRRTIPTWKGVGGITSVAIRHTMGNVPGRHDATLMDWLFLDTPYARYNAGATMSVPAVHFGSDDQSENTEDAEVNQYQKDTKWYDVVMPWRWEQYQRQTRGTKISFKIASIIPRLSLCSLTLPVYTWL
ncbi:hypothetical protein HRG_014085 [Hirsutella rhossiliensis]